MFIQKKVSILFSLLFFISFQAKGQSPGESCKLFWEGKPCGVEEILSMYVQFPSMSGNESKAGEWLKALCLENGLHVHQMGEENGNYNFAASIYPLSERLPNIIFLTHIDVVPPGNVFKWTHPPFAGEISDTEVWGRGTMDNKGPAIIQLFSVVETMRKYEGSRLPYNITFLAVSCEEIQCDGGVKYVVENHLEDLHAAVVIGEGPPALDGIISSDPDLQVFGISTAHKRAFWLKLSLQIHSSGHGSVTPLAYANREMTHALSNLLAKPQKAIYTDLNVHLLKQLGSLDKGILACVLRHPRLFKALIVPQLRKQPELFALFSNTITLTSLHSNNHVINVIPDEATALLDCRLLPQADSATFMEDVKKRLDNEEIKISILKAMPPMQPSAEDNFFFQCLKKTLQEQYPETRVSSAFLPNYNDTGIFRSQGIAAYSIFPVLLEREYIETIHNYDERIPIEALCRGIDCYVGFLDSCMKGE